MTNLKLSRDKNGNKTLNFYNSEMGGFSVQTNGNLPKTHAMTRDNFNPAIAGEELKKYVIFLGTDRQKLIIGKAIRMGKYYV